MCVAETFLKPQHSIYQMSNITTYRADRALRSRGGLAIFINNSNLKSSLITDEPFKSDTLEYIMLNVQNLFLKSFIIVCVYRIPNYSARVINQDLTDLIKLFEYLQSTSKIAIVTGDFNLNTTYVNNNKLKNMYNKINSLGFTQLVNLPTRKNQILDLLFVNNQSIFRNLAVTEPHLSDHQLISVLMHQDKPKLHKKRYVFKDYKNINYASLGKKISECNFSCHDNCEDVNCLISTFVTKLTTIYNSEIPIKSFTKKSDNFISISQRTKHLMILRDSNY